MRKVATFAAVAAILALLPAASLAQSKPLPGFSERGANPHPETKRPIAARHNPWIENITWMEVRDAIRAGKTTAIVPTGGIEQNGPYLVTGKHNVILSATAEAIARKLGDALIAPIVAFVPEGGIDPPSGHMRYPGTIGVEEETFEALLRDIARSLRAHGFRHIVLIGDSGGNQRALKAVSDELNATWGPTDSKVHFIAEYYDWADRQKWLADKGYHQVDEGLHDELSPTVIMLSVDPTSVRQDERLAVGRFSINGVSLAPSERMQSVGRELVDHIAERTARAIRRSRGDLKVEPTK